MHSKQQEALCMGGWVGRVDGAEKKERGREDDSPNRGSSERQVVRVKEEGRVGSGWVGGLIGDMRLNDDYLLNQLLCTCDKAQSTSD